MVDSICKERADGDYSKFRDICGLPLSTYFSAVKLRWMIVHYPEVKKAVERGTCMFGTVDSWLIWNLTGGTKGGIHITDVTNASRTMLMNLHTLQWDEEMLKVFNIPSGVKLPTIKSSAEIYGSIQNNIVQEHPLLSNVLLAGVCFFIILFLYGLNFFIVYDSHNNQLRPYSALVINNQQQLVNVVLIREIPKILMELVVSY